MEPSNEVLGVNRTKTTLMLGGVILLAVPPDLFISISKGSDGSGSVLFSNVITDACVCNVQGVAKGLVKYVDSKLVQCGLHSKQICSTHFNFVLFQGSYYRAVVCAIPKCCC